LPVNSILFNILIADMKEEMVKRKWDEVKLRGEKICTLADADDIVILKKRTRDERSISLKKYLERKGKDWS